jgi:hypothetical protein
MQTAALSLLSAKSYLIFTWGIMSMREAQHAGCSDDASPLTCDRGGIEIEDN